MALERAHFIQHAALQGTLVGLETITQGVVTGALTLEQMRHALAIPRSEAMRLVHELVGASTITMVGVGTQATFTIPE